MRRLLIATLFVATMGGFPSFANTANAANAGKAPKAPEREQSAIDAIGQMGQYLRGLKRFEVTATASRDQVLMNGQLLQFSNVIRMQVEQPNRMQADITGTTPGLAKHAYYDGKTFTILSAPDNYYATVDAPPTLRELRQKLGQAFDIEMPLADLFEWGTDASAASRIVSAIYAGDETIGDKVCSHYAYQEKQFDWQLWIATGNDKVPCKVSIVDKSDPAHPQFTAVYTWQLSPQFSAKQFEFTPSSDSHRIEIRRVDAAPAR